MTHQIIRVEVATLIPHPNRSCYDLDALRRRAESLKAMGQQNPITIAGQAIVDGHLRVEASKLAEITHLDAIDLGPLTPDQIRERQAVMAFHNETLSHFDRAMTLKVDKDAGLSNGQIAAKYSIDPSMATRLLSLRDCLPEVQEAAATARIGPGDWYAISRAGDQLAALAMKLNGATRDELAAKNRGSRNSSASTTKAKLIQVVLDKVTISFKGDVTLDSAITAASAAEKLMDKAKREGHDAQTFAALMKKRKKANKAATGAAIPDNKGDAAAAG